MPVSAQSQKSRKPSPFAGLLPTLTAILLAAVYIRVPRLSEEWSVAPHLIIRIAIVSLGALGIARFFATLNRNFPIRTWLGLSHQRMTIPLEGWIYLGIMFVLFIGAMLTNQNTLMLVFAFMAGPFVVNGWMTFGMLQSTRVQRQIPPRAMQGELFSVELTINNPRPLFSLWMLAANDSIEHPQETLHAMILFSRISPKSSLTGQYDLLLSKRGRYRFGPLNVASRFPLGLIERTRVFTAVNEILIYPRIRPISPNWRHKLEGATELVARQQPHRGIYHDDFHRLREFRSGDNPRAIHWRSTARRGEIILREFQQNRDHVLAIVLDLFQSSHSTAGSETIENTLSFVASLLVERGRDCHDGLLTMAASGKKTFRWEGQGHASSLDQLFDGLAQLEPGPADDVADILNETLQHCTPATQILVVTTRTSDLPYTAMLSHRMDVLNLNDVPIESLLMFDDVRQSHVETRDLTSTKMN